MDVSPSMEQSLTNNPGLPVLTEGQGNNKLQEIIYIIHQPGASGTPTVTDTVYTQ
jgi:hypothetical protein